MHKPLLTERAPVLNPIGCADGVSKPLSGKWWLVMPQNSRDVMYLQMLSPHQKSAAYEGNGIYVAEAALPKLSQN